MSCLCTYTCDTCGKTGQGVTGERIWPDPPNGWIWQFGNGFASPHACSQACWMPLSKAPDGRWRLPYSHEDMEANVHPQTGPTPRDLPEPRPKKERKPHANKGPRLKDRVTALENKVETMTTKGETP